MTEIILHFAKWLKLLGTSRNDWNYSALREMTEIIRHFTKWLKLFCTSRNDWFHSLAVTYTRMPPFPMQWHGGRSHGLRNYLPLTISCAFQRISHHLLRQCGENGFNSSTDGIVFLTSWVRYCSIRYAIHRYGCNMHIFCLNASIFLFTLMLFKLIVKCQSYPKWTKINAFKQKMGIFLYPPSLSMLPPSELEVLIFVDHSSELVCFSLNSL